MRGGTKELWEQCDQIVPNFTFWGIPFLLNVGENFYQQNSAVLVARFFLKIARNSSTKCLDFGHFLSKYSQYSD
jgi:hypothetical protein